MTTPSFQIRSNLPYDVAWSWLARGWADLRAAPGTSLGYGALFALVSASILFAVWEFGALWLLPPLSGGFLLIAPVLAVGLYDTSRRLETGQPVSLDTALQALWRNLDQLAYLGALLAIAWLMWMQFALLLFMLSFGNSPPHPGMLLDLDFLLDDAAVFLIVGTAIGAVLAAIAFSVAVISAPILIDREIGVAEAIAASVFAVRRNPTAMLVWAAVIAVVTFAGFLLFYAGLAITLPLIGHATWHAYRTVIVDAASHTPTAGVPA